MFHCIIIFCILFSLEYTTLQAMEKSTTSQQQTHQAGLQGKIFVEVATAIAPLQKMVNFSVIPSRNVQSEQDKTALEHQLNEDVTTILTMIQDKDNSSDIFFNLWKNPDSNVFIRCDSDTISLTLRDNFSQHVLPQLIQHNLNLPFHNINALYRFHYHRHNRTFTPYSAVEIVNHLQKSLYIPLNFHNLRTVIGNQSQIPLEITTSPTPIPITITTQHHTVSLRLTNHPLTMVLRKKMKTIQKDLTRLETVQDHSLQHMMFSGLSTISFDCSTNIFSAEQPVASLGNLQASLFCIIKKIKPTTKTDSTQFQKTEAMKLRNTHTGIHMTIPTSLTLLQQLIPFVMGLQKSQTN